MGELYFIDTETTGLNPDLGHRPWEVAIVNVAGEVVIHNMWKPSDHYMAMADPMALKINKFYERNWSVTTRSIRQDNEKYVAGQVARTLADATLCGASVHFDARMLDVWMREHGHAPTWSHRFLDIGSFVAGATGHELPASLGDTASRAGVEYESEQKHTALYDAELARRAYVAVMGETASKGDAPSMPTPPPMGTGT